jgi:purine-binding chemotaxis protein CheW
MQLVILSLDGDEYALPIERVQEVIPYRAPRSVGQPQPWLLGVIELRGTIVPVCDLATRLGRQSTAAGADPKIVVCQPRGGVAGLVVDRVHEVAAVDEAQLTRPPAVAAEFVAWIAALGGRLVLVLDVDRLLPGLAAPEPEAPRGLPLRELRRLAGEAGIVGRSRMSRDELLAALYGSR